MVFNTVATNQKPPPDAQPHGAGNGAYIMVGGAKIWVDGNRTQRKRQKRALELDAKTTVAPDASAAENDDVPELDYKPSGGSGDESMGEAAEHFEA